MLKDYSNDPRVCRTWPPNFTEVYARRVKLLQRLRCDRGALSAAHAYYRDSPVDWILDWATTYDPRHVGSPIPTTMPFCLFTRQVSLVKFLHGCMTDQENGLIEKCRDAGATFVCCAFSVWLWLYHPGSSVGFGSRKVDLVDQLGNPDSIFEKIRAMINLLPADLFWPEGFNAKEHMTYMKVLNPENGSRISGEGGDNIGRGGRTSIYFKDESAHYFRPELIEAALGDNTNVQIDISSVNGTGNVFYRRRQAGEVWTPGDTPTPGTTRVFIFDWRDHPDKTQEWYDRRKAKAENEGLQAIFAQEVDRDYASAVEGVVIPSKWVKACVDADIALGWDEPSGPKIAAMDVADGGGDVNSQTVVQGNRVLSNVAEGGEADLVSRKYYMLADLLGCTEWRYEVTGVGTGARSGAKTYRRDVVERGSRKPDSLPEIRGWDPAGGVVRPGCDITTGQRVEPGDKESRRNKDHFSGMKAQGWWHLRRLCHNTYRARYEGYDVDPDECLSIPGNLEGREELINELSQPTYSTNSAGKLVIDKAPAGTKSPNRADSLMIAKSPMKHIDKEDVSVGGSGIDTPDHMAIGCAIG